MAPRLTITPQVRARMWSIWPFIFADIITLGVLTAFPEIVTFIVETD